MSASSGTATKGEKGKSKYSALNINNLYKGNTVEPQQKTAAPKHGMQSLGKVPSGRRVPLPVNLPSLKSESGGQDPNVNLVTPGSTGWVAGTQPPPGSQPEGAPPTQPPTPVAPVANTPIVAPPQQSPHPQPPPPTLATSNAAHLAPIPDKSRPGPTPSGQQGTAYLDKRFQQEFPSLAPEPTPVSAPPQPATGGPTDAGPYGPGPSLRPQRESLVVQAAAGGAAGQGGQMPNAGQAQGLGPRQSGPGQAPPMHGSGPFSAMLPPFMFRGRMPGPGQGGMLPNMPNMPPRGRMPYNDPRYRGNGNAPRPPVPVEGEVFPRPIIKEEDLHMMDEIAKDDGGWANTQDEIDYNKKLSFSDDEEKEEKKESSRGKWRETERDTSREKEERNSKWADNIQGQGRAVNAPPVLGPATTCPPGKDARERDRQGSYPPSRGPQPGQGERTYRQIDEEELWRERQRQQKDEENMAAERARLRREEEDRRFEQARQGGPPPGKKTEERGREREASPERRDERDRDRDWERDRGERERVDRDNRERDRDRERGSGSYASSKQQPGRGGFDAASAGRPYQSALPPRLQRQQELRNRVTGPGSGREGPSPPTPPLPSSTGKEREREWTGNATQKEYPKEREPERNWSRGEWSRRYPEEPVRAAPERVDNNRNVPERGEEERGERDWEEWRDFKDEPGEKRPSKDRYGRDEREWKEEGTGKSWERDRERDREQHLRYIRKEEEVRDRPARPDSRDSRVSRDSKGSKDDFRPSPPTSAAAPTSSPSPLTSTTALTSLGTSEIKLDYDAVACWADEPVDFEEALPITPSLLEERKPFEMERKGGAKLTVHAPLPITREKLEASEPKSEKRNLTPLRKHTPMSNAPNSNMNQSSPTASTMSGDRKQPSRHDESSRKSDHPTVNNVWDTRFKSRMGSEENTPMTSSTTPPVTPTASSALKDDMKYPEQQSESHTDEYDKEDGRSEHGSDKNRGKSGPGLNAPVRGGNGGGRPQRGRNFGNERGYRGSVPRGGGPGRYGGRYDDYGDEYEYEEEFGKEEVNKEDDKNNRAAAGSSRGGPRVSGRGGGSVIVKGFREHEEYRKETKPPRFQQHPTEGEAKPMKSRGTGTGRREGGETESDVSDNEFGEKRGNGSRGGRRGGGGRGLHSIDERKGRNRREEGSLGEENNENHKKAEKRGLKSEESKEKEREPPLRDRELGYTERSLEEGKGGEAEEVFKDGANKSGPGSKDKRGSEDLGAKKPRRDKEGGGNMNERGSGERDNRGERDRAPKDVGGRGFKGGYERNRQKLPPRFAKQQFAKNSAYGNVEDQHSFAKELTPPPPHTNAWEKPINSSMKTSPSVSPGIGSSQAAVNSLAADMKHNLHLKDETPLSPVETIVFENTNFKAMPGDKTKGSPSPITAGGISGLTSKDDKSDPIQLPLSFSKTDDMQLDFTFDGSLGPLPDKTSSSTSATGKGAGSNTVTGPPTNVNANMGPKSGPASSLSGLSRGMSGAGGLGVQSPISPSAADLDLKIASVKKVWDMPAMPPVIERMENEDSGVPGQGNVSTSNSAFPSAFSASADDGSSDGPGNASQANNPYGPPVSNSTAMKGDPNVSNVCKVKPQQQSLVSPGPMSPPPFAPGPGTNQGNVSGYHQAAAAAAAGFGLPAVPSPPAAMLYGSQHGHGGHGPAQQQAPPLYQPFMDGAQYSLFTVINGPNQAAAVRSQFPQYPYGISGLSNLSQAFSHSQSVFLQQPPPNAAPPSQAPPSHDLYQTSVSGYRVQGQGVGVGLGNFNPSQNLGNNSSSLVKNANTGSYGSVGQPQHAQGFGSVGSSKGGGSPYQTAQAPPSHQGSPMYIQFDHGHGHAQSHGHGHGHGQPLLGQVNIGPLSGNYLQSSGLVQRSGPGPGSHPAAPPPVQAIQPPSSYYSGSHGHGHGQNAFYQGGVQAPPVQSVQQSMGVGPVGGQNHFGMQNFSSQPGLQGYNRNQGLSVGGGYRNGSNAIGPGSNPNAVQNALGANMGVNVNLGMGSVMGGGNNAMMNMNAGPNNSNSNMGGYKGRPTSASPSGSGLGLGGASMRPENKATPPLVDTSASGSHGSGPGSPKVKAPGGNISNGGNGKPSPGSVGSLSQASMAPGAAPQSKFPGAYPTPSGNSGFRTSGMVQVRGTPPPTSTTPSSSSTTPTSGPAPRYPTPIQRPPSQGSNAGGAPPMNAQASAQLGPLTMGMGVGPGLGLRPRAPNPHPALAPATGTAPGQAHSHMKTQPNLTPPIGMEKDESKKKDGSEEKVNLSATNFTEGKSSENISN